MRQQRAPKAGVTSLKLNKWINIAIEQQLLVLIGTITAAMSLLVMHNSNWSPAYSSPSNLWITLSVILFSVGIYGIQRQLSTRPTFGKFIALLYPVLLVAFFSMYAPALLAKLWSLLLFYPIITSLLTTTRVYKLVSAVFLLSFTLYTLFILPPYINGGNLSITETLLRILFAIGSVLLGAVILTRQHKHSQQNQELSLQQQKRQIVNILECFIPVGERKTQSSRKEINDMSQLLKSLWRELRAHEQKDWEIDLLSMLHYVSRVKLPDYMFEKVGKLSGFELEVVQEHCFMAKELCNGIHGFEEIQTVFLYHHEKVDGTGYPFQLSGDRIPLLSQALGLVEVYMAMTAVRSYREAMTKQAAYAEIRKMEGEYFHADLVGAFGKIIATAD
jgi:hypothetical protein